MRFITEFEVPESAHNREARKMYIPEKRHVLEVGMGNVIAESFGWQNPINHNLDHHRLEIEAFPMDKWVEFKNRLFYHIEPCEKDRVAKLLQELESFGKPSGDTITNQQLNK